MQFVLKYRVQCLQWYIALVVSFASYPCNVHKTDIGRPKCESNTSIVRYVTYIVVSLVTFHVFLSSRATIVIAMVQPSVMNVLISETFIKSLFSSIPWSLSALLID